jgi:hypothetical protein
VPDVLRTSFVSAASCVVADEPWTVRAARVRPGTGFVGFVDGKPEPLVPTRARASLRAGEDLLVWGKRLIDAAVVVLSDAIDGARPGSRVAVQRDYAGRYIKLASRDGGEESSFWLFVSPAGGRYSTTDAPDAFWLAESTTDPLSEPARERFLNWGARMVRDRAGYRGARAMLAVATLRDMSSEHAFEQLIAWASALLPVKGDNAAADQDVLLEWLQAIPEPGVDASEQPEQRLLSDDEARRLADAIVDSQRPGALDGPFPARHEWPLSEDGSERLLFVAELGMRWRWIHEIPIGSGDVTKLSLDLDEALSLVERADWQWVIDTHLRAIAAAFRERETINRILLENADEDPPTLDLIAGVMTIGRNLEALSEELASASRQRF